MVNNTNNHPQPAADPERRDGPSIELAEKFQALQGAGYGLRLAVLRGRVRVSPVSATVLKLVDDRLHEITELSIDPDPADLSDNEEVLVHRLMRWHLAVQQYVRIPVFDACFTEKAATTPSPDHHYRVAVPHTTPQASNIALGWVMRTAQWILDTPEPTESDIEQQRENFRKALGQLRQHRVFGVNMFHFLQAADVLNLSVYRLTSRIFCVGTGQRSHWLDSSITDRTPGLGISLALNKRHTATLLRRCGLPAPQHVLARSRDEALQTARKLGYPVVVKPADKEQGNGVAANLRSDRAVENAYERAANISRNVLVEKHFHGEDYRLTVFHDRVVKVENRRAGGVTGDGHHSIRELVEQLQQTAKFQKALRDFGKTMVELDDEALELLHEAGLTPETVPAPDEYICLRRKSNISTGGTQTFIPVDQVHEDNLRLAVHAADVLRLDIAGVDLIIPDIARSWLETGAIVCEVNAQPQIGKLTTPYIYTEMLSGLIEGNGQIPVHLLIHPDSGPEPTPEQALEYARQRGCNGVSSRAGVWIQEMRYSAAFANSFEAARALLANPGAQSAFCVMSLSDVTQRGLPTHSLESIILSGFDTGTGESPETPELLKIAQPHTTRPIAHAAT